MKKFWVLGIFAAFAFVMSSCGSSLSKEEAATVDLFAGSFLEQANINSLDSVNMNTTVTENCDSGTISVDYPDSATNTTSVDIDIKYNKCQMNNIPVDECGQGKTVDPMADGKITLSIEQNGYTISLDITFTAGNFTATCNSDTKLDSNMTPAADAEICGQKISDIENDPTVTADACALLFG